MAEPEPRTLAELLFERTPVKAEPAENDLAQALSAWLRAVRAQALARARFGTPSAEHLSVPRRPS